MEERFVASIFDTSAFDTIKAVWPMSSKLQSSRNTQPAEFGN